MSDDCRHDCPGPSAFPKRPQNRPGLSRIAYRIGTYGDFRAALLRALNQDPVLENWTYREADDPGLALLEGTAILGDILTYYQELYANEAYLRTAQWRESVADLVRLLGYRPAPGVGGKAAFALEVKGTKLVTVPQGFPIKAPIEGGDRPADFQTVAESVVYSHLLKFSLYRPRREKQPLREGSNRLEVESVFIEATGGEGRREAKDVASLQGLELNAGDRLILIPSGEILMVTGVQQVLDRTVIEIKGGLTKDLGTTVEAYRIVRTFRHFGYNAPALFTHLSNSDEPKLGQDETDFLRELGSEYHKYCTLQPWEMPLEGEIDDLAAGNLLVCEGALQIVGTGFELTGERTVIVHAPFTAVRKIKRLRADSLSWGNLTGPCTVVTLDEPLTRSLERGNIRRFRFHEVLGPGLRLRAQTEWEGGVVSDSNFYYWGTYDEALALAGRRLLIQKNGTEARQVSVTNSRADFDDQLSDKDKQNPWLWRIFLQSHEGSWEDCRWEDFEEEKPKAIVYGNVIEATQGKTEKEAVLGNGDSRESFQTFKLPKSPLTYFRSEAETPPEVPELEIYVNEQLWKRVSSFCGYGPKDEIYIVRQDVKGDSWVQFGDGRTGARLPSGFQNAVARYRTGTGAYGPLKEGATVQAGARLPGLHKIHLPGPVTGGDEPESTDNAREAAPGQVQSLGRLVSLKDFETETLAIAGVCKVAARWALQDNIPAVVLTVLMERGRKKEQEEVEGILQEANRRRGPHRFPVVVHFGLRRYVRVILTVGRQPRFRSETLAKSIKEVLGVMGEEGNGIDGSNGLFSARQRQFGQPEYATRIEGRVQNIDGVAWAQVKAFDLLIGEDQDPLLLKVPEEPVRNRVVACDPAHPELAARVLLALHSSRLKLTFSDDATEVGQGE